MPPHSPIDAAWMKRALELARQGWGSTHPNPMVGALIVENEQCVAEGWHAKAGGPHAEVAALKALGRKPAPHATLYVTLEPCSTHGQTGACTDAILASGLQRVVIGAIDPNPNHAGRGVTRLREAGVNVTTGVLEEECRRLNLIFNHWIVNQTPLLAGKIALTLDGKIATRSGQSHWITGEAARADVMRWRRLFPAIAAGAGTVQSDDPALTARLPGEEPTCPLRFVFDRNLLTVDQPGAQVFTDAFREQTIVVTHESASPANRRSIEARGVACWALPGHAPEQFWRAFRQQCAEAGVTGLWIEGGGGLLSDLLANQQLDYLFAYRAPKILADCDARPAFHSLTPETIDDGVSLDDIHHQPFGPDVLTQGKLVYPK